MTKANTYTPDQIREMLAEWGRWDGVNTARAGMHLVSYTSVIERRDVVHYLNIRPEYDTHQGKKVMVASVANWDDLIRLAASSGGDYPLLILARAFLDRRPAAAVLLSNLLGTLGHAHAKRVIEAMAIATGYDEWYTLTPGPRLVEHEKFQAQFDLPVGGGQQ